MKITKIAKITSQDCVNWIIQNVAPDTKPSDWKRRSKRGIGEYIVRDFENPKTGMTTQVYEQNGQIVQPPLSTAIQGSGLGSPSQSGGKSPSLSDAKSKYICGWCTVRTPSSEEDLDGYLVLSTRKGFKQQGYGDDQIDEDIHLILQAYGIMASDETNFEIPRGKKAELQNALVNDLNLRSLVQYSDAFQGSLLRDVSAYEFNYDRPGGGASPQGGSPIQAPIQIPSNNQKSIYYAIATMEGFEEGEKMVVLYVTDSAEFETKNRSSDWTPEGAIEELERLGYECGELMEGVIEFNDPNIDIEELKRKLSSSSVFRFSSAYQTFLQVCNIDGEIIPI